MSDDLNNSQRLEELDPEECWQLIRPGGVGRLATAITNHPDIFPVNYVVDGTSVVIRTTAGLKLASAVLGTSVAFEVDRLHESTKTAWSVVLKGRATEVTNLEDLLEAIDLDIEPWAGTTGKNRFIRLNPEAITGRKIDRSASISIQD